jgi:glycosyltransferase involved in cell wall biosynthesis
LLRALARAQTKANLRLVIVGDGLVRPHLERLAIELGVAPSVRFLGYRRDLARIAAATDVAVLSSDNEGTPVSLIEAAAAARPAVATTVGGVPEVVTSGSGILVPPGDDEALAAGLLRLAGDRELRREMGERARDHVLGRFSIDRLVADVDSLYRDLVEDARRERR